MKDKRNLKRRHLIFYLRIFEKIENKLLGYIVDITANGIMIMSENKIEIEKEYELQMVLPANIGKQKKLEFKAKSIWCKNDINTDFYDIGFEFKSLNDDDVSIVKYLIDDFGFRD